MADGFSGFPKETFDFYHDISANNNKEWFDENKPHYKRVPRGYDPEQPRADLRRYNSMGTS